MKPPIVVIGSSNTDMIVRLDHLPRPGETVLGGNFMAAAGGKGANQAVAAARAGGRVTLVARVGRDTLGNRAITGFRRDGIDVRHVSRDPERPSGVALIFVARDGQNSIAVAGGANHGLGPSDVQRARAAITAARVMVLQLETPIATVRAAAQLAAKAKLSVILNPAPARPLPTSLLRQVSVLTPNESEAECLTGITVTDGRSAAAAAAALIARGVRAVILTLGSRGAWVATREQQQLIPGHRVKTVDTTAAGDVFNGALAVALGEGRSLMEAARFANAAAALSVTRAGAQPSAPFRHEITRMLGDE